MGTRILFVGDLHGSVFDLRQVVNRARRMGAHIVQLGDWGFLWPGTERDKVADQIVRDAGVRLAFIDGNHDWHDELPRRWPELVAGDPDLGDYDPGIYYIPRGGRVVAGHFMAVGMGGAPSIDREVRLQSGRKWWPTEEITDAQAEDTIAVGLGGPSPQDDYDWEKAKVLLTHDAPFVPHVLAPLKDTMWSDTAEWFEPLSRRSTALVAKVHDALTPDLHVHGHYHIAYSVQMPHGGHVVGLANNGAPGSSWLVEFDENGWHELDSMPGGG